MFSKTQLLGVLAIAFLAMGTQGKAEGADPPAPKKCIQLGILENQFEGLPASFRDAAARPFLKLMKNSTGIDGSPHYLADPMTLALQIRNGQIDLGVFQGYEFAWAKTKYPELAPLVIAIQYQPVQVFCVVRSDSKAKHLGDLANQKVSISPVGRDLCERVLVKAQAAQNDCQFAAKNSPASGFDALFDVIDGQSGCAVVDRNVFKSFEALYPGKFKNIKVIYQSPVFPDSCIVMKSKGLDAQTVEKFRNTLANVDTLPGGKSLLTLWKLKGFTKVPDDYDKSLEIVQKELPLPHE